MPRVKRALMPSLLADPSYVALKVAVNAPSIFRVLKNASYEIRHSNFLAWLLSPEETHHQGPLFLQAFLEDLELDTFGHIDNLQVKRELENLDLFIFNDESGIVIENKTLSKDSPRQLSSYRQKLKSDERFKHLKVIFIYLTLDGQEPTDKGEAEHWKSYSYERLVSLIERCLKKVDSEKVRTYVSDYIDALRLDAFYDSEYAKEARLLLEKYPEEFGAGFKLPHDYSCADARTFDYIRHKKAYVRGVGFFSSENPFAELFESACRRRNYIVSARGKKQSTYFGFLPSMPDTLLRALGLHSEGEVLPKAHSLSVVRFQFRYIPGKSLLRLSFGLGPPSPENEHLRERIYLCRKVIWETNKGDPVERAGRVHTGIYSKKVPFDTTYEANPLSLSDRVEELFELTVSPFVNSIYQAIERCLFESR
jgi:hypothetical protein